MEYYETKGKFLDVIQGLLNSVGLDDSFTEPIDVAYALLANLANALGPAAMLELLAHYLEDSAEEQAVCSNTDIQESALLFEWAGAVRLLSDGMIRQDLLATLLSEPSIAVPEEGTAPIKARNKGFMKRK